MKPVAKKRYSQLGFTLVELLIAATIGTIIIAGAGSVMISQKNFHKQQTRNVGANAALRKAVNYIRDRAAFMGYGMPRPFVTTTCSGDDYLANSSQVLCAGTADEDNKYVGDRLHVLYRNPLGEWNGSALGSSITLSSPTAPELDANFPLGQTLLVYGGPGAYGLFIASAAKNRAASVSINYSQPTRYSGGATMDNIRAANSALKIGLVESNIFRVFPHTNSKGEFVNTLVVEPGRDINGDGQITESDFLPLADGIYDMQVQYYYDIDGDGFLSTQELAAPVAPATPFNLTIGGGTTSVTMRSAGNVSYTARSQLKAIQITLRVYKTDSPTIRPNSLDYTLPANSRYSISEFIMLRNMNTNKGIVAQIADSNSFTWIGSEILKVSAQ